MKQIVGVAILAFVTGCAQQGGVVYSDGSSSGQPDRNNTARGALLGGAIGAAAGGLSSNRDTRTKALIGAGIGALAGAAVGKYMDRQEAQLRNDLQGTGVQITRRGDEITLDIPSGITFAFDSSAIEPDFRPVLDRVADTLMANEQTLIEVIGHTDSIGSEAYNQKLSERRAQSVAEFLRARGIRSLRIYTEGRGELQPVASNETESGRQENRRVELTLVPVTEPSVS